MEKTMLSRFVFAIVCLTSTLGYAQQGGQRPAWLPKMVAQDRDFAFVDLSLAKISEDKKTVQIVRPSLSYVESTREVTKTVSTPKTATKTVIEGGQEKEVTYTEVVPETVIATQTYLEPVVASNVPERFNVAIEKLKAWELMGKPIDGTALATRLKQATYVLAKEEDPANFYPMDTFYANALRPDLIVIYVPRGTFPKGAPERFNAAVAAPAAPMPAMAPTPPAPTIVVPTEK